MKVHLSTIFCIFALLLPSVPSAAGTSARELGDSLTLYAGFPDFITKVKVKNLRVNRQNVTVYTNKTLSCLSLSPDELTALRRQVSRWVLGSNNGKVSIYSDGYELSELITDRLRTRRDHYTLSPRPLLAYGERAWEAPQGFDNRNIALWPSHGMYYNMAQDRWVFQRARMWAMVEDLYSYEYVHTWLIPMLENAGAYVLEPRARTGLYFRHHGVWLWLGDRVAPEGAEVRYFDADEFGTIARGSDSITSMRPRWMEAARYWLEYTGVSDSVWSTCEDKDDYKDDLKSRGLWVNYLCGGSRANPKQKGLGIQIDACLALHTDGFSSPNDSDFIGTLAIYTNHDDDGRKTFPTGTTRLVNRDLADYVQTQIVNDIRRQVAPTWLRRELNNAGYAESRYPVVPTLLLEVLSHKNLADIMLGLDPKFQALFCRAIYKGLGRWMMGDDFVVQPLPVHALSSTLTDNHFTITWAETPDSIESSARAQYYIVYRRQNDGHWDHGTRVNETAYTFAAEPGVRYDVRVSAANEGGISLDGETISMRLAPAINNESSHTWLLVNNFHRLDGPDWFIDSLRAGIVPGTYPVPLGESRTYLGNQWIYEKQRDVRENGWTDDDNCGWGMCHMNYVGRALIGNTLTFPVEYGSSLTDTYVSCSVDAISLSDSTLYDVLYIHCGQERENLYPAPLRALIERHIAAGKTIHIAGKYLGSALNAEQRTWAERTLGYCLAAPRATVPDGYENAPDAIRAAKSWASRISSTLRYSDTGLIRYLEFQTSGATIRLDCQ